MSNGLSIVEHVGLASLFVLASITVLCGGVVLVRIVTSLATELAKPAAAPYRAPAPPPTKKGPSPSAIYGSVNRAVLEAQASENFSETSATESEQTAGMAVFEKSAKALHFDTAA